MDDAAASPLTFDRLTPDGATRAVERPLAEEVPVAIEYNGAGYAVLMATPSDIEVYLGSALTEIFFDSPPLSDKGFSTLAW